MAGSPGPNFTVTGVHVNAPLTDLSIGYHPSGMIAEQVWPPIAVAHESDLYYKWDKGQAFRVGRSDGYGSMRADKAKAKRRNYGATLDSYLAQEFALEDTVSDRETANADSPLNLAASKIRRLQDEIMLDYEIRVATAATTTSNYGAANFTTLAGANQWNNASFVSTTNGQHSVIAGEIFTGKNAVRASTGGLIPNTIAIPYAVAMVIANDPGLIDLIKYTRSDLLVEDLLPPRLWGMDVLIPRAEYEANVEGEAFSPSDVWGKNVVMFYKDPNPGLDSLTYGLTFRSRPWQVKTYRDEGTDETVYRPNFVQAEKLVAADCAYLINACIA